MEAVLRGLLRAAAARVEAAAGRAAAAAAAARGGARGPAAPAAAAAAAEEDLDARAEEDVDARSGDVYVEVEDSIVWRNPFQKLYSGNDWQERVATAILGPLPDDDSDDAETMLR